MQAMSPQMLAMLAQKSGQMQGGIGGMAGGPARFSGGTPNAPGRPAAGPVFSPSMSGGTPNAPGRPAFDPEGGPAQFSGGTPNAPYSYYADVTWAAPLHQQHFLQTYTATNSKPAVSTSLKFLFRWINLKVLCRCFKIDNLPAIKFLGVKTQPHPLTVINYHPRTAGSMGLTVPLHQRFLRLTTWRGKIFNHARNIRAPLTI